MTNSVVPLFGYAVYEFPWGAAVKEERTDKWTNVYFKPSGQELDVTNLDIILHDNGIEFLPRAKGGNSA